MKTLGGYFELELSKTGEYYKNAVRLNSGRNAFKYLLLSHQYKKLYVPYYTCPVILDTINATAVPYSYYSIDETLEPVFNINDLGPDEALLYTNYFGLKNRFIDQLATKTKNLIIDNAQAFYHRPPAGIPVFYSARKFFGVPDGAYLYTDKKLSTRLGQDKSYSRFRHLLERIDLGGESGYPYFLDNERQIDRLPLMKMSKLTQNLLGAINYKLIAGRRRENFAYLDEHLAQFNKVEFKLLNDEVPMVYPFLSDASELRSKLQNAGIYTGKYWPGINQLMTDKKWEYIFSEHCVYMPVDQRYNKVQLKQILNLIQL